MLALAGITLAIGAFGVTNTMMTSVHERIKDIGIMRAVGSSQRQIVAMFLEEAAVVGVLGGIFGYVAGSLMAYGIGPLIMAAGRKPGFARWKSRSGDCQPGTGEPNWPIRSSRTAGAGRSVLDSAKERPGSAGLGAPPPARQSTV